jgi:hypothetical protein
MGPVYASVHRAIGKQTDSGRWPPAQRIALERQNAHRCGFSMGKVRKPRPAFFRSQGRRRVAAIVPDLGGTATQLNGEDNGVAGQIP